MSTRLQECPQLSSELLDWTQSQSSAPYTCPGTLHTDSAKDRAVTLDSAFARLLTAPHVRAATQPFWEVLLHMANGRPLLKDLLSLLQRVYKLLIPDIGDSEVVQALARLFETHNDQSPIKYWDLHKELLNVCDAWLPGSDPKDYAAFLTRIFTRITFKIVLETAGFEGKRSPSLAAVIMKSPGNPLFAGWSEVREGEAYSDLYVYRAIEDTKGQRRRAKKLKTDLMPEDSSGKLADDVLYDEICMEDEENLPVLRYELQRLKDIVPIGEVAEAYLAHLKFKRDQEETRGRAATATDFSQRHRDSTPVAIYGQVRTSSFPSTPESSSDVEADPFPEFSLAADLNIGRGNCSCSAYVTDSVKEFLRDRLEHGAVTLHKTTAIAVGTSYEPAGSYCQSERLYDVQVTLMKSGRGHTRKMSSDLETLRFLSLPRRRRKEGEDLVSILLDLLSKKYGKKKPKLGYRAANSSAADLLAVEQFLHLDQSLPAPTPLAPDGFLDVVTLANQPVYKILIVGKARAGKTTVAEGLAQQMRLRHIEPGKLVEYLILKIKSVPEDEDPDVIPQSPLSPIEQSALNELLSGQSLSTNHILQLVKAAIALPENQSKGFIVDLPWANGEMIDLISALEVNWTHVVELYGEDEDLEMRLKGVRLDPDTGKLYTSEDITRVLTVPLAPVKSADASDEEEEASDPIEPVKLNINEFVHRPEDDPWALSVQWHSYASNTLPRLRQVLSTLPSLQPLSVPCAGLSPDDICSIIRTHLPFIPPAAQRLSPASELRDLLTLDIKENSPPRLVSPWRKYDPVALKEGILEEGLTEFGAEYCGRVFLFSNQVNLDRFLVFPQTYLEISPALPQYRVMIIGPEQAGQRTQAKLLCEQYGWKCISAEEALEEALERLRAGETRPSHPDSGLVQPSKGEYEDIMRGNGLKTELVWPVLMHKLGIQMCIRPKEVPPEEVENEADKQENQADVGNSDAPSSEVHDEVLSPLPTARNFTPSEAQTTADSNSLPVYEEPRKEEPAVVYEDLPLAEVVRRGDASLGSFVLTGFPSTELDFELLKSAQVDIHKVIFLTVSEETLTKRGAETASWLSLSQDNAAKVLSLAKDTFGEDRVVEIPADTGILEVHRRIVLALDPFTERVESSDMVAEEQTSRSGLCGLYDPVTLATEGWMQPGNKDFKTNFHGKEYIFTGEKELNQFELNPHLYYLPNPSTFSPHLLLLGVRGSGVTTQATILSNTYQLPLLNLRSTLTTALDTSAKARRHHRYLVRGFKPDENYEETGLYQVAEEADPEVAEEEAEFDRTKHEVEVMREILTDKPAIIVGNWVEIGDKVTTPLVELMSISRRLPEIVLIVALDDKELVKRNIDPASLSQAHDLAISSLKAAIAQRRADFLASQDPEDPQEPPEEDEEELIAQLPTIAQRMEEAQSALMARKAEDWGIIEDLKAGFEEKGVKVEVINGSETVENVQKQVNYVLRPHIQHRDTLLLSPSAQILSKSQAQELLQTYLALLGPYAKNSAVSPYEYLRTEDWPVLYRDRLYYCREEEERGALLQDLGRLVQAGAGFGERKALQPAVCVLGPPHSGLSSLCQAISDKYQLPLIRPKDAILRVLSCTSSLSARLSAALQSGTPLPDSLLTDVILHRLALADVQSSGFILQGFPRNTAQAQHLLKSGLSLNPVVALLDTFPGQSSKFKASSAVRTERLETYREVRDVICYLETIGSSVFYLPAKRSKWFALDFASDALNAVYKAKLTYLQTRGQPQCVENLGFPPLICSRNVGKWRRLDPVPWRLKGLMEQVEEDTYLVCHDSKFTYFSSAANRNAYISDPDTFTAGLKLLPEIRPQRLTLSDCASLNYAEVQLEGHCAVCLKAGKLRTGIQALVQSYDGKLYTFEDEEHMRWFARMPVKYADVKLPSKHVKKPTVLTQIADFEASIAYLESSLSVSLLKCMMHTASLRPCFPGLSLKQSALKHLAITLKSLNPANSLYLKSKYGEKLKQFEGVCEAQERFLESGVERKEGLAAYQWLDEGFYRAAEELWEIEEGIRGEGARFFTKYMR